MTIAEPRLAVDDIQGDIIPGFKNDHQVFLFYRIAHVDPARRWLASLHDQISVASEVKRANKLFSAMRRRLKRDPTTVHFTWLNVAITASGLRALTSAADVDGFEDEPFRNGMTKHAPTLGDSANDIGSWLVGGVKNPVDVVLILAGDHVEMLASREKELDSMARKEGLEFAWVERGDVLDGRMAGHEHFGFKDGISQPSIRGVQSSRAGDYFTPRTIPSGGALAEYALDFASPGSPLVWPGHFLFGYGRQSNSDPRIVNENRKPIGPPWATDGSFMVFRRLRQDVPAFNAFLASAAAALSETHPNQAFTEERVGACLVGRWKSGTPLMRSPKTDLEIAGGAANYFLYDSPVPGALPGDGAPLAKADNGGDTCPAAAHIRKVNPRDGATDLGGAGHTLPKLILRRGIPYGKTFDSKDPASAATDRGLLFVCFQSSIADQFAFLMSRWTNQKDRPVQLGNTGHDAVMGEPLEPREFTFAGEAPTQALTLPAQWVTATGGEYFFAPSVRFFRDVLPKFGP